MKALPTYPNSRNAPRFKPANIFMTADGLPPLREVIERHGLAPKKSLGQNFLFDLNLTGRIARAGGSLEGATVLEVGPGPGGLTRSILAEGAARVIAIERDERALPALAEIEAAYSDRLEVVSADALRVDASELLRGADDARIIANLPYNVGTQLLVNWLTVPDWPPVYRSLTLMFQREVAERIVARPSDPAFGRLGVLASWRTEARIAFDVSPKAFVPPPKVTSSVVVLIPLAEPIPCRAEALAHVTGLAFGQRRKMLRQSLKPLGGAAMLERLGIDPTRRPETLSVKEFCLIANAYEPTSSANSPRTKS